MINVIEKVGRLLEANGIGNYDEYGSNGFIVPGKLNNKENNQIVLKYTAEKQFLGSTHELGKLEVCFYNRNYSKAVALVNKAEEILNYAHIVDDNINIGLVLSQRLSDRDVSSETDLLCIVSNYAVDINNN